MIEWRPRRRRWVAVMAAGALLVAGCTGGRTPDDGAAATPETPGSREPPSPTTTAQTIEFEYRPPEEPCLPPSGVQLPSAERYPYEVTATPLYEGYSSIMQTCTYNLADMSDVELDMFLDDHVGIFTRIRLFRSSTHSDVVVLDELPLASADLADWELAAFISSVDPHVEWEGCAPATPCVDGEEPTVRSHEATTFINGRVGNLLFEVQIDYTAEALPADVERRNLAIFRDLVLADVARRERAE
jgi:hypothetical protein